MHLNTAFTSIFDFLEDGALINIFLFDAIASWFTFNPFAMYTASASAILGLIYIKKILVLIRLLTFIRAWYYHVFHLMLGQISVQFEHLRTSWNIYNICNTCCASWRFRLLLLFDMNSRSIFPLLSSCQRILSSEYLETVIAPKKLCSLRITRWALLGIIF